MANIFFVVIGKSSFSSLKDGWSFTRAPPATRYSRSDGTGIRVQLHNGAKMYKNFYFFIFSGLKVCIKRKIQYTHFFW